MSENLVNYLKILRVGHWPKQVFLIPGFLYAMFYGQVSYINLSFQVIFFKILLCIVITNLTSSANYCINEYLDSKYDKYHPLKKDRPSVKNKINPIILIFQYLFLTIFVLAASYAVNDFFFLTTLIFLISGFIYNVRPFRTKDIKIIDVLSESFNNPVRLFLGYTVFEENLNIPLFLVLSYWFGGAFLMACKRLSEKIFLKDNELIEKYRPSIAKYLIKDLKIHIMIYSILSLIFLFLFFYTIDIFYSFLSLLFIVLFYDYYNLSIKLISDIQTPEKLFFNPKYILKISLFSIFLIIITLIYESY